MCACVTVCVFMYVWACVLCVYMCVLCVCMCMCVVCVYVYCVCVYVCLSVYAHVYNVRVVDKSATYNEPAGNKLLTLCNCDIIMM